MDSFIHAAQIQIHEIIKDLRVKSYVLALTSEAEAIGKALGRPTKYNHLTADGLKRVENMPAPKGGSFEREILHNLFKIRDKLKSQLHWLIMNPDVTDHEGLQYFLKKLPRTKPMGSMKKSLKPIKKFAEADEPKKRFDDFSSGYIDDATWDEILDDYHNEMIHVDRSPGAIAAGAAEGDPYYAWELERDVVNDFVQQVRSGQVDAANINGITDFVVISVIDDKTCEGCCDDYGCVDFDGLLTSEVEKMTKGKYSAPPYHFNCRCALAPATDDIPDKPESNEKDFNAWLNTP